MQKFVSHSETETEKIAENFARELKGGEVLAFTGGLGMGKTCFTRGLANGLGLNAAVSSPTFAIVNEYLGGRLNLYHFDMYRINGFYDLYSTGFFDYIDENSVLAVEWSENIASALPEDTVYINFERISDNERIITIGR